VTPLPPVIERLLIGLRADRERYLKDHALVKADALLTRIIEQVESAFLQHNLESFDYKAATAQFGLSASTLSRAIADGHLKNVGTPHRPRVERLDLERFIRKPRAARGALPRSRPVLHQEP
jgi:hypothetical protein